MKKIFLVAFISIVFVSCNVQERILFDENMGGTYEMSFDLSAMLEVASKNGPATSDKPKKKIDTLIVFSEMLTQFKDSIATLPPKKQEELAKLENMTMHMQMDEENNVFKFSTTKTFNQFSEIAFVSDQMDEVFNMAKNQGVGAKSAGPGSDMLKTDKVIYTFENNTFSRLDEKAKNLKDANGRGEVDETNTEEDAQGDMLKGMLAEFDDMLKNSNMTLEYSFPKQVKSVSHKDAKISEDGKTVTYNIDWKTLLDDKKILETFEVTLENQ